MKLAIDRTLLTLVAACLFLLAGPSAAAQSTGSADTVAEPAAGHAEVEYEYAQLLHVWSRGLNSQNYVVWTTPDERVETERLTEMYEELGGALPSRQVALIEVFNRLGQGGWELVYSPGWFHSGNETNTNSYMFRRPVIAEGETAPRYEVAQLFVWNIACFWKRANEKIDADSFESLYEQMQIQPEDEPSVSAMLDALQADGWRVVISPGGVGEGEPENYFLARPRPTPAGDE